MIGWTACWDSLACQDIIPVNLFSLQRGIRDRPLAQPSPGAAVPYRFDQWGAQSPGYAAFATCLEQKLELVLLRSCDVAGTPPHGTDSAESLQDTWARLEEGLSLIVEVSLLLGEWMGCLNEASQCYSDAVESARREGVRLRSIFRLEAERLSRAGKQFLAAPKPRKQCHPSFCDRATSVQSAKRRR